MATATKLTVFVTSAGFDVLMQRGDAPQTKARIGYNTMRGVLDGSTVQVSLVGTRDDELKLVVDGVEAELRLQPKGHFFGYVGPKAEPIGLAAARKLIAAAAAEQRAGRPSRGKRTVLVDDMPHDEVPFGH